MLSRTMVEHSVFDALAAEAAVKVQLDLFFRRAGLSSGAAVGVGTPVPEQQRRARAQEF